VSPLTQRFYEISYEPLRLRPADRADEVIEYAKCPLLAQGDTDGSSNYLRGLSYVPSRDAQIFLYRSPAASSEQPSGRLG